MNTEQNLQGHEDGAGDVEPEDNKIRQSSEPSDSRDGKDGDKGGKKTSKEFVIKDAIEVEGMGLVTKEHALGLKDAKNGLENKVKSLEEKLEALENDKLSAEERKKKEDEARRETYEKNMKALIKDKIAIELEKAGIFANPSSLKIEVDDYESVEAKVKEFAEANPELIDKKKVADRKRPNEELSPQDTPSQKEKILSLKERLDKAQSDEEIKDILEEAESQGIHLSSKEERGGGDIL